MAANDIELKDKSGATNCYDSIYQIEVPGYDQNNNPVDVRFTRVPYMNAYLATISNSKFVINKKLTSLGSNNLWYTAVTETTLRENGEQDSSGVYGSYFLFSLKNLTVGESYSSEDLKEDS